MILKPGIRRFVGQTGANRHLATVPFWAPLKSSLALVRGVGSATFTRATTATVTDFEGNVHTALAGEARFTGARRVQNRVSVTSEVFTNAAWLAAGVGVSFLSGIDDPNGGVAAFRITASGANGGIYQSLAGTTGHSYVNSLWIRRNSGSGPVYLRDANNASGDISTFLTTTWKRFSINAAATGTAEIIAIVIATSGDTVDIFGAMQEDVTGQSNQNPAEYVSNGVLSFPYHGAGVDGVQYFETLNGNTVSGDVVTEAVGAAIPDATLKGYLPEPLVTNYLLNSNAPATQTTGSLGVGTYCMWLTGAGSVAISAGTATITGAGTATAATPLVFQVTVAGTVTATVTAPVTEFQLENSPYPTSFILTAGAPVARNADVDSFQTSGNIAAAAGTIALSYTTNHAPSGTIYLWGTYVDANNSTSILHDGVNLIFRKRIAGVNSDATIANAFVSGTRYKMCASWGAAGTTIYLNGTAGTPNANTTAAQIGTTMQFGADGNGSGQPTAEIRDARIWQSQQTSATQAIIST